MPIAVYLQILLATFLWGTAFPAVKAGLETVPPLAFAGLRFTLAGALLLIFSIFVRGFAADETVQSDLRARPILWTRVLLIGLCSTALFYGFFFLGMHRTSASSGAVVDGSSPIVSAVIAHFILHGDRLTGRKISAILLSFLGVAVIALLKPAGGASEVDTLGCVLIFIGMIVGACGSMMVITYRGAFSLIQLTGAQMCFGGGLLLVTSAVFERGTDWLRVAEIRFVVIWLYLSAVSAVAFSLWYGLIRRYKVTSLSIYSFLTGLWGAVLSIVFRGDRITMPLMVGLVFVVAGVILMNTDKSGALRDVPHPEEAPPTP